MRSSTWLARAVRAMPIAAEACNKNTPNRHGDVANVVPQDFFMGELTNEHVWDSSFNAGGEGRALAALPLLPRLLLRAVTIVMTSDSVINHN